MKRKTALLLLAAVVVALALLAGGSLLSGPEPETIERGEQPSGETPPTRAEPSADPVSSVDAETQADPTLAGSGAAGRSDGTTVDPTATADGDRSTEGLVVYAGEVPDGWKDAAPAQRPHAIRPPRPRGPSIGPGGSGGTGPRPTGHWSRFPPPLPPAGDATLAIVVLDAKGARVPGADLYLGPPASWKQPAVSFGDLRRLGTTDAKGELVVERLPVGAAALAANLRNQLNGPRGLDARSSIPVLLLANRTVGAELRLPLDLGAYGRITGRVVDEKKSPIARAMVVSGYVRVYTDAEGRFEMATVPEGLQGLAAGRSGYATGGVEVEVPRGGVREVEIVLAWKEAGDLVLEGRVTDAEGRGLEGANLYLIDVKGRGTLRSLQSGPDGDYRFEELPERLRTAHLRVQAGKGQEGYPATNVVFEEGLPDDRLDIRLPPRRVKVVFRLRDAGNGEPLTRMRIEPERLDDETVTARGFTGRSAEGDYEHYFDAGRYRFTVEAPDHETKQVEVDLPRPGERVEVDVEMVQAAPDSAPVTLRVTVTDATTDAPVPACWIELVHPDADTTVARFDGTSGDGVYSMPAPSGRWRVRVGAKEHETAEETVTLEADTPEADVAIHLRPR